MAKRRLKKVPRASHVTASANRLTRALSRHKKAELIDVIVGLAKGDRRIMRQLESRFGVETPPEALVAGTRQAIADATDFDERQINYNFDYDDKAYSEVKRNFGKLTSTGHLRAAMELSLELMSQGSYQVETSDEGMMTADIEECLQVVIKALGKGDLPASNVIAWCAKMIKKDRVGFICDTELRDLQARFKGSSKK